MIRCLPIRFWVVVSVAIVLASATIVRSLIGAPADATPELPTGVAYSTPNSVVAGATAAIGIRVDSAEPVTVIEVMIVSGERTVMLDVPVEAGEALLEIGPPLTDRVGLVSLVASTRSGAVHASFVISPGATAVVDPLAGPRTIVADGTDETMVVSVPVDELGNAMPDGTVVVVSVSRPDGTTADLSTTVANGIADVRFPSTTLAGPLAIAASSGAARGPAVRVDQVAGRPAPFTLLVPEGDTDRLRIADGRTLHTFVTTRLLDEHGNVLPDGVSVDVEVDTPTGPGRLTTHVIAGRAEFHLESPALPGVVRLEATLDGVTGAPISLDFDRAVDVVPARIDVSENAVIVGPVLDIRGAFVPDGTVATIGDVDVTIQNGTARVAFDRAGTTKRLVVAVLGATTILEVPR